jgi:hypothetical protein
MIFWVVTPWSPGSGYQVSDKPAKSAFKAEGNVGLLLENGDVCKIIHIGLQEYVKWFVH